MLLSLRNRLDRWMLSALLCCIPAALVPLARAAAPSEVEKTRFFEEQVKPILDANCIKCHGGEKTKGGLELTSRQTILSGGDTGPAVSLEQPAKSLLLKAISHTDSELQMPPKKKLADPQIVTLTRWVELGIPMPLSAATKPARAVADDPSR